MKRIFKNILVAASAAVILGSCDFLEPYPNGSYNEDNYKEYPKIIRGFVDKTYNLRPRTYNANEFIGTDCASDNAVYRAPSNAMRQFSIGSSKMTSNPFSSAWERDYTAIYYANLFLEDDLGLNTHYLVDPESDQALKLALQGDAYAMRAWYLYDLLKIFGGEGSDGKMYGVPIHTKPIKSSEIDNNKVRRATYDETVAQILKDIDSAMVYLPYSNRDYPGDKITLTPVTGSVRYRCADQVAMNGLRAMTYLLWASPAFCNDASAAADRYRKAAEYASLVIKHKIEKETPLGFDPLESVKWSDVNGKDVVWPSPVVSSGVHDTFFPIGFQGTADINPSQNLVDCFPMANGYPIDDVRSGYDAKNPYEGRDPRFYGTIFHDGSSHKNSAGLVTYTFDCAGADAPSVGNTSVTSYYIRKFTYADYNPFAATVVKGNVFIAFERFEQMCLIFAEAACQCAGPEVAINGLTAKQALSFIRSKTTRDNVPGLGVTSDPYLDECAASAAKFLALVKNEWRITTCFEGYHYYNVRRWTADHNDLSAINVDVKGALVTADGSGRKYDLDNKIESRSYPSLWNPLPYSNVRRCPNLVQNKGWESWK